MSANLRASVIDVLTAGPASMGEIVERVNAGKQLPEWTPSVEVKLAAYLLIDEGFARINREWKVERA
jgi:hypothetical protein